jgi:hypothetical protein
MGHACIAVGACSHLANETQVGASNFVPGRCIWGHINDAGHEDSETASAAARVHVRGGVGVQCRAFIMPSS